MHISTAFELVSKGEPAPEELVDLQCPNCSGQFSSRYKGIHELGGREVTFKNYVGTGNRILGDELGLHFDYTCPNNCTDMLGNAVLLDDIHSIGQYTPYDLWLCAKLVVEQHYLEPRLAEVEKELKNYSNRQI
tara:strand:- start:38 stop:436 length:399 start_codon:yes stop_codon:yes gene_type:complete